MGGWLRENWGNVSGVLLGCAGIAAGVGALKSNSTHFMRGTNSHFIPIVLGLFLVVLCGLGIVSSLYRQAKARKK